MIENVTGMTPGQARHSYAARWSYGDRYDVPVITAPPPGTIYVSTPTGETKDTGWHAVLALALFCLAVAAGGVAVFGWPLP